ncbi:MAG TPA: hypothetical protein VMO17_00345, partial [Terriglobia bacterium]|nr:hypothetical protein [Terriglobia bacterium]
RKKDLQSWTQKLEYESDAQEARNLSDNQAISISLLGIKLGSADMDIFGALGLLMTSTYYLLCMRRMSGELGSLLSDVDRRDDVESRYLILGARQSYVLNAAVAEDVVYPDNLAPAIRRDFLAIRLSRGLFSMLTFLPSITALMILTSDWYYLLTQIPQSYGSTSWWWSHLGPEFKRQFIVMHTMAWIAGVGIFLMNSAVYRIQRESAARMNKAGIRRAAPVSPKVAKSSR